MGNIGSNPTPPDFKLGPVSTDRPPTLAPPPTLTVATRANSVAMGKVGPPQVVISRVTIQNISRTTIASAEKKEMKLDVLLAPVKEQAKKNELAKKAANPNQEFQTLLKDRAEREEPKDNDIKTESPVLKGRVSYERPKYSSIISEPTVESARSGARGRRLSDAVVSKVRDFGAATQKIFTKTQEIDVKEFRTNIDRLLMDPDVVTPEHIQSAVTEAVMSQGSVYYTKEGLKGLTDEKAKAFPDAVKVPAAILRQACEKGNNELKSGLKELDEGERGSRKSVNAEEMLKIREAFRDELGEVKAQSQFVEFRKFLSDRLGCAGFIAENFERLGKVSSLNVEEMTKECKKVTDDLQGKVNNSQSMRVIGSLNTRTTNWLAEEFESKNLKLIKDSVVASAEDKDAVKEQFKKLAAYYDPASDPKSFQGKTTEQLQSEMDAIFTTIESLIKIIPSPVVVAPKIVESNKVSVQPEPIATAAPAPVVIAPFPPVRDDLEVIMEIAGCDEPEARKILDLVNGMTFDGDMKRRVFRNQISVVFKDFPNIRNDVISIIQKNPESANLTIKILASNDLKNLSEIEFLTFLKLMQTEAGRSSIPDNLVGVYFQKSGAHYDVHQPRAIDDGPGDDRIIESIVASSGQIEKLKEFLRSQI